MRSISGSDPAILCVELTSQFRRDTCSCNDGYFKAGNFCQQVCPGNQYRNNRGQCIACPTGTTSTGASTSCKESTRHLKPAHNGSLFAQAPAVGTALHFLYLVFVSARVSLSKLSPSTHLASVPAALFTTLVATPAHDAKTDQCTIRRGSYALAAPLQPTPTIPCSKHVICVKMVQSITRLPGNASGMQASQTVKVGVAS